MSCRAGRRARIAFGPIAASNGPPCKYWFLGCTECLAARSGRLVVAVSRIRRGQVSCAAAGIREAPGRCASRGSERLGHEEAQKGPTTSRMQKLHMRCSLFTSVSVHERWTTMMRGIVHAHAVWVRIYSVVYFNCYEYRYCSLSVCVVPINCISKCNLDVTPPLSKSRAR